MSSDNFKRARDEGWDQYILTKADEIAVAQGCYFDHADADHVCEFFPEYLQHSKGKRFGGQPFELLDWQKNRLLKPLFGWKAPDGMRRFRVSFTFTPKKQGKSTLAAGVGLYLLAADMEPGAEVYSAAADADQAAIVHGEAINMVNASPVLSEILRINRSKRTIDFPTTQSVYKAITSGAESKHGFNIHGAICDEVHGWYGRELWDVLRYGGASRDQSLIFVITTAGDNLHSLCGKLYKKAKAVLAGDDLDTQFFPLIFEADVADDWTAPETWHKAMPSLGQTINENQIAREVEAAKSDPAEVRNFKRLMLNLWTSPEHAFIDRTDWQACHSEITSDELAGRKCWGGFDLGVAHDLTSLCLTFPDDTFETFRQKFYFWMSSKAAKQMRHVADFVTWGEAGLVQICQREVVDYAVVEEDILSIIAPFDCQDIAYDPYGAAGVILERIENETGVARFHFRQGWQTMAPAVNEYYRAVKDTALLHDGHELMTWQIGHCVAETDKAGNKRLCKPKHGDHRTIDGVIASVMSYKRAFDNQHQQRRWFYEDNDVSTIDLT